MWDEMKLEMLAAWPQIRTVLSKRRAGEEVTVNDIARIGRTMKGGVFARAEDGKSENQEKPHIRKRCGAKNRQGNPCRNWGMPNGRCRFHGGKSTGPRTEEGKTRIGASHLKHGRYTKEAIEQRRLAREARDYWAFHLGIWNMISIGHYAAEYLRLWKRISGEEIFLRHFRQNQHLRKRALVMFMRDEFRGVISLHEIMTADLD